MKKYLILLLSGMLLLSGCTGLATERVSSTVDPYAGMVQVDNGAGGKMWVTEYDNLSVNPYLGLSEDEIREQGGILARGIDVSEHQGEIDWKAVAEAGIRFAVIRAAYRGYGESGILCEDACFRKNFEDARENGIAVGLYFFSQAIDTEEAEEEAEFLLNQLTDISPEACELPVFFDWENISTDNARTDGIGGGILTDCAVTFCKRIEEAGFTAGVYAYRSLAYHYYDLPSLEPFELWIGALGDASDFYYEHEFWQYGIYESMDGVSCEVDVDYWLMPPSQQAKESDQ